MLATKISFMNELSNLAEILGADIEKVRIGIGSDPRIGFQFIYPGCGYGGSCFPKDVQALEKTALEVGYQPEAAARGRGREQPTKRIAFRQDQRSYFDGDLSGKTIALWGLAFKPNTDDMRAASSRTPDGSAVGRGRHACAHSTRSPRGGTSASTATATTSSYANMRKRPSKAPTCSRW